MSAEIGHEPVDFPVRKGSHASIVTKFLKLIGSTIDDYRLPSAAKAVQRRDKYGLPHADIPIDLAIDICFEWLCRAQDFSNPNDGGVSRHFSLISGWASSYPETTGYIIPTFLDYAELRQNEQARDRAKRMLDWLVSIQFPEGAFQGGKIDADPRVPVTFNTGQILIGLARGHAYFGTYYDSMCAAADWLVETQDSDGCWRKFPTPFAAPGEKSYETHVAWGLFEAARLEPGKNYAEAAIANNRWAIGNQRDNGWIDSCCLSCPAEPLTHTLGYALRGIIEAYRFTDDPLFLEAAQKTADGLLTAMSPDGFIAGQLMPDWAPAANYSCLTGTVQIAHCWLMLYQFTEDERYREAGLLANRYVRRTMQLDGPCDTRGAIRGSFPVNGFYGRFEYLNWAAKFFIDAQILELSIGKELVDP